VKFLRRSLVVLGVAIVLLGMLVGGAFIPGVQTWYAQSKLDAQPEVHGTVGSMSVGLGHMDFTDLHLETAAAVIDVPSLHATLPVKAAVWDGKIQLQSLVAKGWTIDLSRPVEKPRAPAPAPAAPVTKKSPAAEPPVSAEAAAVQEALKTLRSILGGRALPYDLSLEGVELEGDVVLALPTREAIRIHLVIKGGGLAAAHEGFFAVDADAANPWPGISQAGVHGQVRMAASSPRRLNRFALKAEVSIHRASSPDGFLVTTEFGAAREPTEETYTLVLSREGRPLATMQAHHPDATHELAGDWKVDLRNADLALMTADHPWPALAVTGGGHFQTDLTQGRVRVGGRLNAAPTSPDGSIPGLDRYGAVTLATHFNFERRGGVLRFDDLGGTLTSAGPVVSVQSRGAFEFDEKTAAVKPVDPSGDWLDGSLQASPQAWVSDRPGAVSVAGSNLGGDFVIRVTKEGFALRPKTPFVATGLSVRKAGRMVARDLDVSLAWLADYDAAGWRVQCAPLVVKRAGRRLASIEAQAAWPSGANQPMVVKGTWNADLEAMAAQPETPVEARFTARSASGDFTWNAGSLSWVDGKITVIGHDPKRIFTARVSAQERPGGKWAFQIPVKMEFGSQVSDLSAEGNWSDAASGGQSYIRLTGEKVDLAQLRPLAVPLAAMAGLPALAKPASVAGGAGAPDRAPFWGNWVGSLVFDFDQLKIGDDIYSNVGGSFDADHGALRLEHGRGGLRQKPPVQLDGEVTFEAAAEWPYHLKAKGDFGEVDAATIWPVVPEGQDALVEGRFTLAGTLTGRGSNLGDLAGRTQLDFKLAGTKGIIRLLKTDIGDALPQDNDPGVVSETLGGVSNLVGKLLAVKFGSGEKSVSKTMENVLTLSSIVGENVYDSLTVTGHRSADGTIQLSQIVMLAENERLQGSGEITAGKGLALAARPLRLDLLLGVRGDIAGLFAQAGLLSDSKDKAGFTNLSQTLRFDGSLAKIDPREWHDLLVKAATKKSGGK
jgi:hypothetical protein